MVLAVAVGAAGGGGSYDGRTSYVAASARSPLGLLGLTTLPPFDAELGTPELTDVGTAMTIGAGAGAAAAPAGLAVSARLRLAVLGLVITPPVVAPAPVTPGFTDLGFALTIGVESGAAVASYLPASACLRP